jgi:hypothetical protein
MTEKYKPNPNNAAGIRSPKTITESVKPILIKPSKNKVEEKKHLSVYLPANILRQVKMLSMDNGKRVNDIIVEAIKLGLEHYNAKAL